MTKIRLSKLSCSHRVFINKNIGLHCSHSARNGEKCEQKLFSLNGLHCFPIYTPRKPADFCGSHLVTPKGVKSALASRADV